MDKDLELLHQKIDFLTEQMMATQKRQQELEELRKDLVPITSDLFKTAVEELDEIAPYFSYEDIIFLVKKLLRNMRGLTAIFEQLESAQGFLQDALPLSKDVFQTLLENLDEFEKKGYFKFFAESLKIVDNIVTSFSEEDVRHLGENVVLILNTVKEITQPEMMHSIQNALMIYKDLDVTPPEKTTLFGLVKELNDPQVRKGLATGLAMLKKVTENLSEYSAKQ